MRKSVTWPVVVNENAIGAVLGDGGVVEGDIGRGHGVELDTVHGIPDDFGILQREAGGERDYRRETNTLEGHRSLIDGATQELNAIAASLAGAVAVEQRAEECHSGKDRIAGEESVHAVAVEDLHAVAIQDFAHVRALDREIADGAEVEKYAVTRIRSDVCVLDRHIVRGNIAPLQAAGAVAGDLRILDGQAGGERRA